MYFLKSLLGSSSRTRLVKDLKPKDSAGKYEVAKKAPRKLDEDKGSKEVPEKDPKVLSFSLLTDAELC